MEKVRADSLAQLIKNGRQTWDSSPLFEHSGPAIPWPAGRYYFGPVVRLSGGYVADILLKTPRSAAFSDTFREAPRRKGRSTRTLCALLSSQYSRRTTGKSAARALGVLPLVVYFYINLLGALFACALWLSVGEREIDRWNDSRDSGWLAQVPTAGNAGLPQWVVSDGEGMHMNTRRKAISVVISIWMAACSSIGPGTVPRDRVDYVNAIGTSWERETLLNIVKLRYGHAPIFFSVTQVVTGYQFQTSLTAGFGAANFTPTADVLGLSGTASAEGQYTDRPTVIYTPLTGIDFLQKLMTPIPPSAVLFVLQAGGNPEILMPITLDSINGINNESRRGMRRTPDPRFSRVAQLVHELQLAGALQVRIQRVKDGNESSLMSFAPSKDPQAETERHALRSLLGLKPDLQKFQVYYGGYSGKDDEIAMMTRSMLEVMFELAADVRVPESDVTEGRAGPGLAAGQADGTSGTPVVNILSGRSVPSDASIAVQYNGRWFWIADTDFRSKTIFGIVMLLFSISDIGTKGTGTIVTVPANG